MMPIMLPGSLARQIRLEGIATYPDECCGILFGRDVNAGRVVERIEAAANEFDKSERFHRFSISPRQLMQADRSAAERDQSILGFYHSHPDHPARPSDYDREHAWPFYSYLILSTADCRALDLTTWVLDGQTGIFARQELIESDQHFPERQGKNE